MDFYGWIKKISFFNKTTIKKIYDLQLLRNFLLGIMINFQQIPPKYEAQFGQRMHGYVGHVCLLSLTWKSRFSLVRVILGSS